MVGDFMLKISKQMIFGYCIGVASTLCITAFATATILSKNISYSNPNTSATNVADALNELYKYGDSKYQLGYNDGLALLKEYDSVTSFNTALGYTYTFKSDFNGYLYYTHWNYYYYTFTSPTITNGSIDIVKNYEFTAYTNAAAITVGIVKSSAKSGAKLNLPDMARGVLLFYY